MLKFKCDIVQFFKERISLFILYFLLGFNLVLPSIMLRFLFIESRGLGASKIAQVSAIIALPWGFKILFGFISDLSSRVIGKHFQIAIAYLLAAFSFSLVGTTCGTSDLLYLWLFLSNLFVCFADVVQDAILVYYISFETSDNNGRLQSYSFAFRAIGSLTGTFVSAFITRHCIAFSVICVCYMVPAFVSIKYLKIPDRQNLDFFSTIKKVCHTIKEKEKTYLVYAIIAYALPPNDGPIIGIFFQKKQQLQPLQFAYAECLAFVAITFSSIFYNKFFRKIAHVRVITITSICMLILPWLNVMFGRRVIEFEPSSYLSMTSFIGAFLGHISFMPIAVMAAKYCPRNIEATMYAFFMALLNFFSVVSYSLSSIIISLLKIEDYESDNIWYYYMLDISFDLLSIYFVQKFISKSESIFKLNRFPEDR